ncbi:MAG: beta-propeller fold lactonase family protein [Planctomycetota bacterium]
MSTPFTKRALGATALTLALSAVAHAQTSSGQLYTITNAVAGNEVAIFDRASNGALTYSHNVATGGVGTGGGLGNQGAVILTQDERFLLAINAGSNDLSVFRVEDQGLTLLDVEPVRGLMPVSVTQHDDVVYVVNAGTSSISGFRMDFDGQLDFMPGSLARLSAPTTGPAQVQFGARGQHLYVTEKATNRLTRFDLNASDLPVSRTSFDSPGATPFGFALGLRGQLIVSEAAGGAAGASTVSSYAQVAGGALQTLSASVSAGQTAACWIVATPDGRIAFSTNTADDNVTSFSIGFDGSLTVLQPIAASTPDAPIDMAVTRDGRFLYVLSRNDGTVADYSIGADGSLAEIPGGQMVLPTTGTTGLAVR